MSAGLGGGSGIFGGGHFGRVVLVGEETAGKGTTDPDTRECLANVRQVYFRNAREGKATEVDRRHEAGGGGRGGGSD